MFHCVDLRLPELSGDSENEKREGRFLEHLQSPNTLSKQPNKHTKETLETKKEAKREMIARCILRFSTSESIFKDILSDSCRTIAV